jgi:hypothetical protein
MGIEEQFRDAKGCRFGLKLKWTNVGNSVDEAEPSVQLESRAKGARIGSYYWRKVSQQLRLTARFVREHLCVGTIASFL